MIKSKFASKPTTAIFKDRDWLVDKYSRLSAIQIGEICRVSNMTVGRWLRRFNTPRRSSGEAVHLRTTNHCNFSKEATEWIDGEL
ncbi:MAG: hypothetical protein Q8L68_04830, partial [Methylococcales bacterium]|nr:hypothetical protein [Methylococcales bacterium]